MKLILTWNFSTTEHTTPVAKVPEFLFQRAEFWAEGEFCYHKIANFYPNYTAKVWIQNSIFSDYFKYIPKTGDLY